MEDFIFCAVTVEILYEKLETQCKKAFDLKRFAFIF